MTGDYVLPELVFSDESLDDDGAHDSLFCSLTIFLLEVSAPRESTDAIFGCTSILCPFVCVPGDRFSEMEIHQCYNTSISIHS